MKTLFDLIGNFGKHAPVMAVALLGLAILGCTRPGGSFRDSFRGDYCGWFKLPARTERKQIVPGDDTLIPVFQRGGTYYSVWRGFEIPFRACPEGLEWALTPSSMAGTKIGWDAKSKTYYLAVMDSQADNYSDGRYGIGEKESLTRTGKPSGLLPAKARHPRSNDDFLGAYQLVWLPQARFEIRKEGERYVSQKLEFSGPSPGTWKASAELTKILPLPDQPGFCFEQDRNIRLVYDENLKRFELVVERKEMTPSVIHAPLARLPAHSWSGDGSDSSPMLKIGIPAWH
jgi:hypothetical protein